MHVFKFSPRKGTVAEKMENQISENIKEERSKKLIELSNKNETKFVEKFIGMKVEVLFEEEKNGFWQGHTTNYITVRTKEQQEKNKICKINVKGINNIFMSKNL